MVSGGNEIAAWSVSRRKVGIQPGGGQVISAG